MKRFVFLVFISAAVSNAQSISVETLVEGNMSIRALLPDGKRIWYAADGGRCGFFDCTDNTTYEKRIVFDTIKPEFRSIAQTRSAIFIMGIGSPALLYKIEKQSLKANLVYRDTHKNSFYDAIAFFDDLDGIAVGDPVDGKFSIIVTHDGGNTWNKMDDSRFPFNQPGEAAFAASNTNINIVGNKVWIVSGGTKARVFFSPDRGNTWQVFDTPIIQGSAMTGIFTSDFYNDEIGIIAGGDYDRPNHKSGNKAVTTDGGKTWKLVAENQGFGYASCIQFIPDNFGKRLLCVGATGIWYSPDLGESWKKLSDDNSFYTIRIPYSDEAYAAGKGKIVRFRINE